MSAMQPTASLVDAKKLVAVILAGGQGRRMGHRNKPLIAFGGHPLITAVIARLAPQAETIVINANDNLAAFTDFGMPIQPDVVEGYAGPLAGILSGMAWMKSNAPHATHLITVAADTPFFPLDYVAKMSAAVSPQQPLAVATWGARTQPVFGLWPVSLFDDLEHAIRDEHIFKVDRFSGRYGVAQVAFDDEVSLKPESQLPTDQNTSLASQHQEMSPFFNINTPDDLDLAEFFVTTNDLPKNEFVLSNGSSNAHLRDLLK